MINEARCKLIEYLDNTQMYQYFLILDLYIEELEKMQKNNENVFKEFTNWLIENYNLYIPLVANNSQAKDIFDKLMEIRGKYE